MDDESNENVYRVLKNSFSKYLGFGFESEDSDLFRIKETNSQTYSVVDHCNLDSSMRYWNPYNNEEEKEKEKKELTQKIILYYQEKQGFRFDEVDDKLKALNLVESVYNDLCQGQFLSIRNSKNKHTYMRTSQKREYRFSMSFPTIVDVALGSKSYSVLNDLQNKDTSVKKNYYLEAREIKIPRFNISYIELLDYLKSENYFEEKVIFGMKDGRRNHDNLTKYTKYKSMNPSLILKLLPFEVIISKRLNNKSKYPFRITHHKR